MVNHVHFIAVPMEADSLARTFHTLHMRYSQYINQNRGVAGHLWQGRFYSCALDEPHLYAAIRYVENNPVRAKIVGKAYEYKWSSARSHTYKEVNSLLTDDCHLTEQVQDWHLYLEEKDDEGMVDIIRSNSKNGRPCGDDGFIQTVEGMVGRRLKAMPKGRPKKAG